MNRAGLRRHAEIVPQPQSINRVRVARLEKLNDYFSFLLSRRKSGFLIPHKRCYPTPVGNCCSTLAGISESRLTQTMAPAGCRYGIGVRSGRVHSSTQAVVCLNRPSISLTGTRCFSMLALRSECDKLSTVPTRSATPTIVFDPFLISAMRPRTAVSRERISHVFSPARILPIQGSAITRPFNALLRFLVKPMAAQWTISPTAGRANFSSNMD